MVLDDVLREGLALVVCGTAAGTRSAQLRQYYAGPGNKFWRTLAEVGLTPYRLAPGEAGLLPRYGIGLTDLVKGQSGADSSIRFGASGPARLREEMLAHQPRILCFNGKRAAQELLGTRTVHLGVQQERIGMTELFVAPSTSAAANGAWDVAVWRELAERVRGARPDVSPADGYTVVRASVADVAALPAIERAAATRFRGWDVPDAIMAEATPCSVLEAARVSGLLWVALDSGGSPAGFVHVEATAGGVHVKELDVHPDHGRRGIGAALLREVERWALAGGYRAVTLTTYRDVPWNAPYYERLGFEVVPPGELDADLTERLAAGAERGLDPARRVAMRLRLGAAR